MERRMTASGGGGLGWKGWGKRKRTHGHGPQCGDCWGEGETRGLKGNETIQ